MELQVGRLLNSRSVLYLCRNPSKSVVPYSYHQANKSTTPQQQNSSTHPSWARHESSFSWHHPLFRSVLPRTIRPVQTWTVPSLGYLVFLLQAVLWYLQYLLLQKYSCINMCLHSSGWTILADPQYNGTKSFSSITLVFESSGVLWPIVGLSFSLDPSALLGVVLRLGGLVCMGMACQVPILAVLQSVACLLIGL